ncbi:neurofascin-like [Amphiura filiformis]|uniref:neurofascin-like n=1 Tax=Amphiura filiformis TaxID=82378 RepID=UPI003B227F42
MNTTTSAQPRFQLNSDGSLTIYRVMQSYDEGMYMCKANNTLGEISASGELRVRARTRVECHVAETVAKRGKHVFLRCSVNADPALQATVTWEKNGKPLNPGCSDEDRIFQPPELGVNDHVLVIRSITREDSGVYGCVARTVLDKSADQTTLIVQDVPDRPGPVEVTYRTENTAIVSWAPGNENSSPTELIILHMKSIWDPVWKIVKMLPPGSRSTKVDLEPWTSYYFRVKQLNSVGYSEHSEASATYRTAPSRPYSNPENVRADSTNSSAINVYWTPMPPRQFNGPGFHYVISWRQPDLEDAWQSGLIKNPLAGRTIIPINGEYGEYEIRVRAANEVGMAPTPWSINVFPMSEQPSAAPKFVNATAVSPTKIEIKWKPIPGNKNGGVLQGYMVRYWRQGAAEIEQKTTPSTATMIALKDLIPASEYVIYMFGYNQAGDGPTTNNIDVETPEDVPGPVTDFRVEPVEDSLYVHWTAPTEPNGVILGYQIIITRYDGPDVVDDNSYILSDPYAKSYNFTNLPPDTIFRIELQARTGPGLGTVSYWEVKTLLNF